MCFLISRALSTSTFSTASLNSFHVGRGSICLSHAESIACRQSSTPSSSFFILSKTCLSTPRRAPMVLHLFARERRFLNASLNFGLSSIMNGRLIPHKNENLQTFVWEMCNKYQECIRKSR